jgi:hypothetical protein
MRKAFSEKTHPQPHSCRQSLKNLAFLVVIVERERVGRVVSAVADCLTGPWLPVFFWRSCIPGLKKRPELPMMWV